MSKNMREEYEKMNRGRHKEHKEKKNKSMSSSEGGKKLIGEKIHKASGYDDSDWGKVNAMISGKHPTTNICTNQVSGGKSYMKSVD